MGCRQVQDSYTFYDRKRFQWDLYDVFMAHCSHAHVICVKDKTTIQYLLRNITSSQAIATLLYITLKYLESRWSLDQYEC